MIYKLLYPLYDCGVYGLLVNPIVYNWPQSVKPSFAGKLYTHVEGPFFFRGL